MRPSWRGSFDSTAVEGEEATPFVVRRTGAPSPSSRFAPVAAGRRAEGEGITAWLQRAVNTPTALTRHKSQCAQPMGQGVPSRSSRKPPGDVTHFSMMGGLPNLSSDRPKNPPKIAAKTRGNKSLELNMQLQQGHFEREGFLDVGSQPALELFHEL